MPFDFATFNTDDHITLEQSQQFSHIEDLFQSLEETNCELVKVNPNTVTLKGHFCVSYCDDNYSDDSWIPFTIEIPKAQWERFQSEYVF